jgi:hypothetical protein
LRFTGVAIAIVGVISYASWCISFQTHLPAMLTFAKAIIKNAEAKDKKT